MWSEARAAGYGEVELRQLGRAVSEGRVWRGNALSPGELVRHLLDLLAEACAPAHGRAPWRRENPFDAIADEIREQREKDEITVDAE